MYIYPTLCGQKGIIHHVENRSLEATASISRRHGVQIIHAEVTMPIPLFQTVHKIVHAVYRNIIIPAQFNCYQYN